MVNSKNVNANEQLVANQFVWLLNNRKPQVVQALVDAGIDVSEDIEPIKLKGIIEKAVVRYNASQDKVAKKVIFNVSSLIVDEKASNFSSFMDDEEEEELEDLPWLKVEDIPDAPKTEEKKSFKLPSLDSVLKVGNLLIGAFGSGKVSSEAVASGRRGGSVPTPPKKGISTGKIIAIAVGGLIVIGAGVFLVKIMKNDK